MVYAYHYCILQSINILIVLKTLCAPSIQLLYLVPTNKYWYFLLSTKFCFSRIPYAWNHMIHSLLNWLLSFSNMHLSFLHIFSWLDCSFLSGAYTHCSILAWEIPWTEEPGGLQSMGSQRVRDDWMTEHCLSVMVLKVHWKLNFPSRTLWVLISFCQGQCLYHSFKGCSLPPSLLFHCR